MATENQKIGARIYTKQYLELLSSVFAAKNAFAAALAPLQTFDGIRHNASAFSVKTNNTPVVIGTYNTGANVAFGTGTSSTSRFGNRTEIIYTDTDVPYSYEISIHEGLDIATVNAGLDEAVADRLELQAQAHTRYINSQIGTYLSTIAGESVNYVPSADDSAIKTLFNTASKYYVDHEVSAPVSAYLEADLFNAIMDSSNTVSGKGSSIAIDNNGLAWYKNFKLFQVSETYFPSTNVAFFVPDEIVLPFIGAEIARVIESEDFAGVAIQAYAKGGNFVLDDNKEAIIKVIQTA